MTFLDFFAKKQTANTASAAKNRLQIIIARERSTTSEYDFMPKLEQEIIAIIAKYINVPTDDIKISMEKSGDIEVLDVNVQFPPNSQAN